MESLETLCVLCNNTTRDNSEFITPGNLKFLLRDILELSQESLQNCLRLSETAKLHFCYDCQRTVEKAELIFQHIITEKRSLEFCQLDVVDKIEQSVVIPNKNEKDNQSGCKVSGLIRDFVKRSELSCLSTKNVSSDYFCGCSFPEEKCQRCLVCGMNLKYDPDDNDKTLTTPPDNCSVMESQLSVMFLVRQILELSRESLEMCFQLSDGQNPEFWMNFCKDCERLVRKAKGIYQHICASQEKMRTYKRKLSRKIISSATSRNLNGDKGKIRTIIWDFVDQKNNGAIDVYDPTAGDRVAAQLINKYPPKIKLPLPPTEHQEKSSDDDYDYNESESDLETESDISTASNELNSAEDNSEESKVSLKRPRSQSTDLISCPHCTYRGTEIRLQRHIVSIHPPDGIFSCQICSLTFSSVQSLRNHRSQNHKSQQCPQCHILISSRYKLKVHLHKMHENPRICELCGKQLRSAFTLKLHQSSEHFKCSFKNCVVISENKQSLHDHQISVHGKERDAFKCPDCPKLCTTRGHLRNHLVHDHAKQATKTPKTYQCEDCGENFVSSKRLWVHRFNAHGSKDTIKCPHCDYTSNRNEHVQTHILFKHSGRQPKFRCNICGKEQTLERQLERHQAAQHNKCSVKDCKILCGSQEELREHQVNVHGRELNVFRCDECGKMWTTFYHMRGHLKKVHGIVVGPMKKTGK